MQVVETGPDDVVDQDLFLWQPNVDGVVGVGRGMSEFEPNAVDDRLLVVTDQVGWLQIAESWRAP